KKVTAAKAAEKKEEPLAKTEKKEDKKEEKAAEKPTEKSPTEINEARAAVRKFMHEQDFEEPPASPVAVPEKSVREALMASENKEADAEKYFYLGNEYAKNGRFDLAITEYQKAIALDPENANSYENLAISYAKKGAVNKAIETMDTVIKLRPEDADKRATLGIMLHAKQDFHRAMKEYTTALQLNPTVSGIYYNMAVIFSQQKKYVQAWKCAKMAYILGHTGADALELLKKTAPKDEVDLPKENKDGLYLRQIVVASEEQAATILERLQKDGDFAEIAREYSLPAFKENGGYMGRVEKKDLLPLVSEALDTLALFELSPVLAIADQFHIFQKILTLDDLMSEGKKATLEHKAD
ncbi:MAG: tetratricopeptide repeat protein, partial [Desulfobulbaceae bacterium]|nr:tetratricopeptide repeat protein [Desulfobulbaceae bacterium]